MSPIPPIMKKIRSVRPARINAIFKKIETISLTPLGFFKALGAEFPKNASPIENANLFTKTFYYRVRFKTSNCGALLPSEDLAEKSILKTQNSRQ